MTIRSANFNPFNDTKYARRRSVGQNNALIDNVIQSLVGMGRLIHNYSGVGAVGDFERDWGGCRVHRDTTSALPNVYNLPANSHPGGVMGPRFNGTAIAQDLQTIWLELGMMIQRRGIGSNEAPNSRIVVAEAPNHHALEIIVYKGRSTLPGRQDESSHFYEWEMVHP